MSKPKNFKKPPMKVKHSGLVRCSEESEYKSRCPVCLEGVLLIYRDEKTLELKKEDCCISCGQRIIYLDIKELRTKEGLRSPREEE